MSETQALIDLSRELGETQLILTNVEMDRDAYRRWALYLQTRLGLAGVEDAMTFGDYLRTRNIPHPSRQS